MDEALAAQPLYSSGTTKKYTERKLSADSRSTTSKTIAAGLSLLYDLTATKATVQFDVKTDAKLEFEGTKS